MLMTLTLENMAILFANDNGKHSVILILSPAHLVAGIFMMTEILGVSVFLSYVIKA